MAELHPLEERYHRWICVTYSDGSRGIAEVDATEEIDSLKAERDRLRERLGKNADELERAWAERDRLREALKDALPYVESESISEHDRLYDTLEGGGT